MEELIKYILDKIVDHPDDLKIESLQNEEWVTITAKLNPDDMGKVIGKGGKTINSIRSLVKILASKAQKRCNLNVEPLA
ncbi:KH domain-containing protein [Candidatus Collierbacteria bacterium]|nr:KH domain-containing protein [Candidatus Collierbacteria bacterium]